MIKSLPLAGLVAGSLASPALNVYWGSIAGYSLRDVCDSGVNYVTLAFINNSPEHGGGYPGSNFGAHCSAEVFVNEKGEKTKLLSTCRSVTRDIPYCQTKNVKVLLSIGGRYGEGSNYSVSSEAKGVEFAHFLYNAFGPFNSSWKGPRPFDADGKTVSVDGFDLDLEGPAGQFDNKPYVAMVDWWRKQSKPMFITAAPQCVITNQWNRNVNDDLIANAKFDALFIQFYNNGVCDAIPGNTPDDEFSYHAWANTIAKGKSRDAKLFIGLPAHRHGAGSGYLEPEKMKELVCQFSKHKNFGGVSLWEGSRGLNNTDAMGKSYLGSAAEAVMYPCRKFPASTSAQATPTATTTESDDDECITTSETPTPSTMSFDDDDKYITTSETPTPSTMSFDDDDKYITTSETPTPSTMSFDDDECITETSNVTATATVGKTSSVPWSNSTTAKTIQTSQPISLTTSQPISMTTSTVYTTTTFILTECPSIVTGCTLGRVTTQTIALYTTVCPVTEPAQTPEPTSTKAPRMTTSTVYNTKVYTITQCPSTVTDCPARYVTEVISAYTTVCPVEDTETGKVPKPTGSAPMTNVKTGKIQTPDSLPTSLRPTAVPQPSGEGCTGPSCPGTSVADCIGPECPGVMPTEKPTGSAPMTNVKTTSLTKTVKIQTPDSLPTSLRPTAVPQPSGEGCTGPSCPGTSVADCIGPECPGVMPTEKPTEKEQDAGCAGLECSGVASPIGNAWTKSPVGPSAVPVPPVTAGASGLALGLTGLVAVVAAQLLAT
ncbi:chitinase 18-18 [Metarhizium album ARSEF 1941]|uniref:chitinase n=1 Tax=Metarhizium album (strain ARSEF 1941) TaxID=1081103 RepID=A0A0B2X369_METAS|nr:chitinase 18-18 [Metarhizium album ARSEF 1941]KHO00198.1 chitinase 18-18 [Metarhizium album ARSEF 1941]